VKSDYFNERKAILNEWLEKPMTFEETQKKLDVLNLKYLKGVKG